MLRENPSGLIVGADAESFPSRLGHAYTADDLKIAVVGLPPHGVVLRADGHTPVGLGDTLTAAELAGVTFSSARSSRTLSVLYVPQSGGRWPIPLDPEVLSRITADGAVTMTEMPGNGSVFLADAVKPLNEGDGITAAQLAGLTFCPSAEAAGQISLLRYDGGSPDFAWDVLVVVGPDMPIKAAQKVVATRDDSGLSPFAVALLMDLGLSASDLTTASASVDPSDSARAGPSLPVALMGIAPGLSAASHPHVAATPAPDGGAPAPILAQSTGATETTSTSDMPVRRVGSSSPPDFGSLTLTPVTPASATAAISSSTAPESSISTLSSSSSSTILSSGTTSLQSSSLLASPTLSTSTTSGTTTTTTAPTTTLASTSTTTAANPIVAENQLPGTPQSIWQISPGQDSTQIQGFTTAISSNLGGTVQFKINNQTGNPNYTINIYRLGYYGGDGARLITTLQHQSATSVIQPAPLKDASTGLVDAGNWSVTDSWTVPTTAVSGVYIANVIDGTQIFQIPFVIRNDASHSAVVFQTDDQTWQAYNPWGGANLYAGNGPGVNGSAYAVSYNRPITTRDGGLEGTSNDMVFSAEYPAIYWLEQNGYDVSYISGIDAATNGALLLNHQVYMDVGHDEYWTDSQVSNVQAAGHAGVNLMFLSGNEVYWQTRLGPSIDPSATANRTLISYKDTHANALIDPTGVATGTFMDARFASSGGMSGVPSNALTGTVFQVDSSRTDTLTIPYGMTQLRFWRNTPVAATAPGQTASLVQNLLGYEWDSSPDNGFRPGGLVDLSSTTLQVSTYLLDYGNTTGNGAATHNLVEFRDPVSGALVFGAGTVFWSWGLASDHDQFAGSATPTDPNVQQAMVNLFADMGVQPATIQASLVIASQTTDRTAPTSTVTNLSASSVVEGQKITLTGTATDVGGVIGGVEVSTDSGKTWHPATSTVGTANVNWSYTFVTGAPGTFNIESRAVDDSLNVEAPSAGVSYNVTPSPNLTIFSPTDTPAIVTNNDSNAVELGVKFVPSVSGKITGIRFYKGSQNTGTHLGDLWTTNGTLLASATFTNETASGWQQVNFATPVQVQAGTTYIASYHTNTGHYSTTDFYFDNPGHTNGSLTATGSGLNGVYAYGAGPIFPGNVSIAKGDNYWVDVVFNDAGTSQTAPVLVSQTADQNATIGSVFTLTLPAGTFTDYDGDVLTYSATTSSGAALPAWLTFNASTETFSGTPTSTDAGTLSIKTTATDTAGLAASEMFNINVSATASLFTASNTPTQSGLNDGSPIELGVKFTSSSAGQITALKFYRSPGDTGSDLVDLWSATGARLASATFSNTTATGWQTVTLATPVSIAANTIYVASYHTSGTYVATSNFFSSAVTSGGLTAPSSGSSGGNGVYAYGGTSTAGIFPTSSYNGSNYYADVVFSSTTSSTQTAPVLASQTPDQNATVGSTFSLTLPSGTFTDSDGDALTYSASTSSGAALPSWLTFNASTQTFSGTPTSTDAGTLGVKTTATDTAGLTASETFNINVSATASLFTSSNTPARTSLNDGSPLEVGVKFTSSSAGQITALKFYRSAADTGPDIVDLWSATGTNLASATFSNTSAAGWQTVTLATPVSIAANTTYVASYHTSGAYVATDNFFTSALTSGPLTAPSSASSGGNGVYAYGGTNSAGLFPTNTFGSANYYADVVFKPQLAA